MRVLLISHTVFSKTLNMGKTLLSYFSDFSPDEIAQLYIHSEVPTDSGVCTSYYRFTDSDALKSILNPKRKGNCFTEKDIDESRLVARTDVGVVNHAYVFGSKRKAWSMVAREYVWKLSRWKNNELKNWIDEVNPDIVVFASGDYGFMYDIAYYIAEYCHKPLVVMCFDDFYLFNKNKGSVFGKLHHRMFMKSVRRTIGRCCCIFTLSDLMNQAYRELFHKPCHTVHNSAVNRELKIDDESRQVSYVGNVGFERLDQLIIIGKVLSALNLDDGPNAIDVYTGTFVKEFLEILDKSEGIELHGRIDSDEVLHVLSHSLAVIHTESFSPEMRQTVRFSVSTKIAESLMYGPCLIAYGPEDIASIAYLKENNAAYVITSPEDLAPGLREILTNKALREEIVANARRLAAKNHDTAMMSKKVRGWLQEAIDSSK